MHVVSKVELRTFYKWIERNFDNLKERYEIAQKCHAENLSEQIDKIILESLTDEEKEYPHAYKRRETFVKKKMWELEKNHPNQYGNHFTVTQNHTIDLAPALRRIANNQKNREIMKTVENSHKST